MNQKVLNRTASIAPARGRLPKVGSQQLVAPLGRNAIADLCGTDSQHRQSPEKYVRKLPAFWAPCRYSNIEPDRRWLGSEHALALPGAAPIADGHIIFVPRKHVSTIYQMAAVEQKAVRDGSAKSGTARLPASGPTVSISDSTRCCTTVSLRSISTTHLAC